LTSTKANRPICTTTCAFSSCFCFWPAGARATFGLRLYGTMRSRSASHLGRPSAGCKRGLRFSLRARRPGRANAASPRASEVGVVAAAMTAETTAAASAQPAKSSGTATHKRPQLCSWHPSPPPRARDSALRVVASGGVRQHELELLPGNSHVRKVCHRFRPQVRVAGEGGGSLDLNRDHARR